LSGNLICDLDGVVWRGSVAIAGSADAIARLRASGWKVLFCTNNSSRRPAAVAERLAAVAGVEARADQVVTSAQAAARMLEGRKPPTFVLGGEGIDAALAAAEVPTTGDPAVAEAVVVGLDPGLTYERLRRAVQAVRAGARLIATNLDPTYPADDGLWPGAGAIVAAVETAAGAKAEPAGKPYAPMRELLAARLGPGPTWVVGDRADTDLAMAVAEPGWKGALVASAGSPAAGADVVGADLVGADLAAIARGLVGG
jgi:4-nitrophenyl phosphatase